MPGDKSLYTIHLLEAQTRTNVLLGVAFERAVAEVDADRERCDRRFDAARRRAARTQRTATVDGRARRHRRRADRYEIFDDARQRDAIVARGKELPCTSVAVRRVAVERPSEQGGARNERPDRQQRR